MSTDFGPCDPWDLLCAEFPDGTTPKIREQATRIATEVLWNRTKKQFGLCTVKLRPCREDCTGGPQPWIPETGWGNLSGASWPFPALIGGNWINVTCGGCFTGCSCSVVHEIRLPYPVHDIIEVKVDGQVMHPARYRVDDYHLLVRLDGEPWPRCNDLNLDDDQEGTWSVTARYGQPVPDIGKLAAGELAVEIAKRCVRASGCILPSSTVREVTRQGVKKVFFDADTAFKGGSIGLYYSDMFIKTYNPTNSNPAVIFDIDGQRSRRVGTA